MNDEDIVTQPRSEQKRCTAVELAELLDHLTHGGLSQGAIVTYFKRAFPSLPLSVLIEASGWERVSDGGLTDEDFNALLNPWLGGSD